MKAKQISNENGAVKFSIEFAAEEFKEAIEKAYKSNRDKFSVDGFRKGKAPRKIIENLYGADVFFDEALNNLLDKHYFEAIKELGLDVISQPKIDAPDVKKDEPVVITGTVQIFPEVDVKKYKGLEIEKFSTKIGAKEVKEELEKVQKSQARMETVEGRKSEKDDTVILDFCGSVDGVEFDGGKAENFELKLGSGQFIPGFEEQLEGKDAGEEVNVEVTFPEDYHVDDLKGKLAQFKCKIHEIKKEILPEINDELASDVSEFETLAEFKKDLKKKLQADADARDEAFMKDRALEKLYEENPIEAPEVMVQNELDNMIYDMNQNLASQGLSLQQYIEWTGKTIEQIKEEAKPEAIKRIKTRILLKNIIRIENLLCTDEEVEELIKEFGVQYGMTADQVKEMAGPETVGYFKEDAQTKKAIELIFEHAKKEEVEVLKMDDEKKEK